MIGNAKTHNRKLGLLGADMVMARFKADEMKAMKKVRDEAEAIMVSSGYLAGAPFEWITLSLRFGLKNDGVPRYEQVNEEYGDLPIAIELDSHELQHAGQDELTNRFMVATLKALVDVGRKYKLPHEKFEELLAVKASDRANRTE
jgi:hypothetical protein